MSNTESSAISRLINEAHGPVIEPYRSTPAPPAPSAAAQRIARGTIAPHQALPSPQLRPTQEQAWFDAGEASIDDLIEEPDDDGVPISVTPEARAATPWQGRADSQDETPLPRVVVEQDSHDVIGVGARGGQLPQPARRVSAQIVAPLPSPVPFGTPAPETARVAPLARPVAQVPVNAPTWNPNPTPPSVESMSYWKPDEEEERKPRRTFLWIGLAGALVGAGFLGFTALRPHHEPAVAAAAIEPKAEAVPAKAEPVAPAPVAAAPVAAPEVAAAPAPETLTAGFTLPGIPVDTRVVFDGKQLGIGPMKVQRLAPGPHKLELIAANGGAVQELAIDLAADAITPLTVPAAAAEVAEAPAPAPAPEVAAAPVQKAHAAPARAVPAAAPKAEKRGASHEEAKKVAPKARAQAKESDDSADDDSEPVAPKHATASKGDKNSGMLLVNAKPPCEIIVDGKKTGLSTPQRDLPLSPGAHTITLVNAENHIKKSSKVKITAGKPTRLVVDLTDQMD